jgi:regulatory protein
VWHKNGVMAHLKARRAPKPLNEETLNELALRYVGRFATTRAKLGAYLGRKLRERGWDGPASPDPERIVERVAELGYVDDASYALSKSRSLTGRGYGKQRVVQAMRVAGIDDDDSEAAREFADAEAVTAALRFAEKRRLGPYASREIADPKERQKSIASMVRAGHGFELARKIVSMRPGDDLETINLGER